MLAILINKKNNIMGFDFDTKTLETLKDAFNAVKGKTWTSSQKESFQINSMKEFSSVLGECMADAVCDDNLDVSFLKSTDSELANAACTIMKKKFGL